MRACLCAPVLALALSSCAWFRPSPPHYDEVRLDSGVVLRDLVVPDEGQSVVSGDTVAIHFDLCLADRTSIESSRATGQPLRFEVGAGVVPRGLEQGVLGMRLFGRRRILVPAALAYGAEGRPPRIPPDAALSFDVELMELVHAP